jgi:hypothetical protein
LAYEENLRSMEGFSGTDFVGEGDSGKEKPVQTCLISVFLPSAANGREVDRS